MDAATPAAEDSPAAAAAAAAATVAAAPNDSHYQSIMMATPYRMEELVDPLLQERADGDRAAAAPLASMAAIAPPPPPSPLARMVVPVAKRGGGEADVKRAEATERAAAIYLENKRAGKTEMVLPRCCDAAANDETGHPRPAESSVRRAINRLMTDEDREAKKIEDALAKRRAEATMRAAEIHRDATIGNWNGPAAEGMELALSVTKCCKVAESECGVMPALSSVRRVLARQARMPLIDEDDTLLPPPPRKMSPMTNAPKEKAARKKDPADGGANKKAADITNPTRDDESGEQTMPSQGEAEQVQFSLPTSKSSKDRKQCICDWGDDCCRLNTFFNKEKHFLGGFVDFNYSTDSCIFLNTWKAAVHFMRVPLDRQAAIAEAHEREKDNPDGRGKTRIKIAKFHFPPEIVDGKGPFNGPITRERAEELKCYENRNTPPDLDGDLMRYDPQLGSGQSKRSRKKFEGQELFVVAPCMTLDEVTSIAAAVHGEEYRVRTRTPEEWREVLRERDDRVAAKQAEINALRREVSSLRGALERKDAVLVTTRKTMAKHSKRARRAAEKREEAERALACAEGREEALERALRVHENRIERNKKAAEARKRKTAEGSPHLRQRRKKDAEEVARAAPPTDPPRDDVVAGQSDWRYCKMCLGGGIVQICANCGEWYHDNTSCHDFRNCNPGAFRHPFS